MKVEIYENNGGAIMMAILEDEKPIAIFENWECGPEDIIDDAISQLRVDRDAWKQWDGYMLENANDRGGRCAEYDENGAPIMEDYTLETLYEEISEDDLIREEYIDGTIKEIIQSTGMTQTAFAKKFDIPLRTVQNWYGGQRECPAYVKKMIVKILENEKENEKMRIQFEAGTGRHFDGVNFMIGESDSISIYAEVEVPEGASEDYGYITMKNAILAELTAEEKASVKFWYDGQEQHLAEDAKADCEVYTEIER